jgi:hypothetical protein
LGVCGFGGEGEEPEGIAFLIFVSLGGFCFQCFSGVFRLGFVLSFSVGGVSALGCGCSFVHGAGLFGVYIFWFMNVDRELAFRCCVGSVLPKGVGVFGLERALRYVGLG